MYLTNKDLELLIRIENKLGSETGWDGQYVHELWQLNEKLINQRNKDRAKVRTLIAKGRAVDKNYGRGKGGKHGSSDNGC